MIISLKGFTGEASLVEYEHHSILAYRGPRNLFTIGAAYTINSQIKIVELITPSQYIPGVINVRFR